MSHYKQPRPLGEKKDAKINPNILLSHWYFLDDKGIQPKHVAEPVKSPTYPTKQLSKHVLQRLNREYLQCILFPTAASASRCLKSLGKSQHPPEIVRFNLPVISCFHEGDEWATFFAVICGPQSLIDATTYCRDTGDAISTSQAQYCLSCLDFLESQSATAAYCTRPRKIPALDVASNDWVPTVLSGETEKQSLREMTAQPVLVNTKEVFLFPNKRNALYTVSRALASLSGTREVVSFGTRRRFLQRSSWSKVSLCPGTMEGLDGLKASLASGRRIQALFCEYPGEASLAVLRRIRSLALAYNFLVVCDASSKYDTDVLPLVDVLVTSFPNYNTSLSSVVVNSRSLRSRAIMTQLGVIHEDTLFPLDAIATHTSLNSIKPAERALDPKPVFADIPAWYSVVREREFVLSRLVGSERSLTSCVPTEAV